MSIHRDLPQAELHEPKGIATLTGGAPDVGKVNVSKGDGTSEVRKLKPSDMVSKPIRMGFVDYNDLATQTTPISVPSGTPTVVTNDVAGPFTSTAYAPTPVTDIWDEVGNAFDFTQLALGDAVDIRFEIEVTTTSANQTVQVVLELGQGGSPYNIPFSFDLFKTAGAYTLSRYTGIYMGDANTLNNPGQFKITSDSSCTVKVAGWYCKILTSKEA